MPGIGITLPIRLGNTGMFAQSQTVVEQTKSNFVNLILTKKGERLPPSENLGCDLWNILFEPLTQATAEKARIAVMDAVDTWMPFIELVEFKVKQSNNENELNIVCTYRFKSNPNVQEAIQLNLNTLTQTLNSTTNIQDSKMITGTFKNNDRRKVVIPTDLPEPLF